MTNINYILAFMLGVFSCLLFIYIFSSGIEMPVGGMIGNVSAPSDSIKDNQIHVYENAIVIDVENAGISKYAATGSMLPLLDENSNGIRIQVKSESEINVGDIITFEKNNELIIHRVIEKGIDNEGVYFITKGDNSGMNDSKIRIEQIKYKTIGVLW